MRPLEVGPSVIWFWAVDLIVSTDFLHILDFFLPRLSSQLWVKSLWKRSSSCLLQSVSGPAADMQTCQNNRSERWDGFCSVLNLPEPAEPMIKPITRKKSDLVAVSQVSSLNYEEAFLCRSTWWSICCHLDSDWLQRPFAPTPVVTVNSSIGGVGVTVRAENTASIITQNVKEQTCCSLASVSPLRHLSWMLLETQLSLLLDPLYLVLLTLHMHCKDCFCLHVKINCFSKPKEGSLTDKHILDFSDSHMIKDSSGLQERSSMPFLQIVPSRTDSVSKPLTNFANVCILHWASVQTHSSSTDWNEPF